MRPGQEAKRILGIIPNYRTAPIPLKYEPLTIRKKFMLASKDAMDRSTVALSALLGGESLTACPRANI
jgi:hypothetical protein